MAFSLANEERSIRSIAKQFKIPPSSLNRRLKGVTLSRDEYLALHNGKLNKPQENILIKHIDMLSAKGCPPTHAMLRNFAREICGKSVGKMWSFRFVKRNEQILSKGFLDSLEFSRKKADSARSFAKYFSKVFTPFYRVNIVLIE